MPSGLSITLSKMSQLSFRDRFFTPSVARAMTSPGAILLAGAGAGVVIATGLPLLAAPIVGLGAYVARVLAAVPRNEAAQRIDAFALPEPWRSSVVDAQKAQVRFGQAVKLAPAGPIRDRLVAIGERIDDGINEAFQIAKRGAQLVEARRNIDPANATRDLAALGQQFPDGPAAGSTAARTADALQSQIETATRLDEVLLDVRSRLQLLDARLDESVARAVELSVSVGDVDDLGAVGADVDGLVNEMEALRQALEETARTNRAAPSA